MYSRPAHHIPGLPVQHPNNQQYLKALDSWCLPILILIFWQGIIRKRKVNTKSFPSLTAHRAALISVSQGPQPDTSFYTARPWIRASVSRGVPVYVRAVKPVPNYTAWWQRHMCVNNLPKVVTQQCPGAKSNLRLWVTSGLQVRHVTVRLPSHDCIIHSYKNVW